MPITPRRVCDIALEVAPDCIEAAGFAPAAGPLAKVRRRKILLRQRSGRQRSRCQKIQKSHEIAFIEFKITPVIGVQM
jgi:hypothetical protein